MMGNEGSLSLSEIAGSERNDVSTKPSSDAPDSAIDELIEKWRHLDVSIRCTFGLLPYLVMPATDAHVFLLQNGLPCLLDKTRQDISITKVSV